MNRLLITILVTLLASTGLFAQLDPASLALRAYTNKDLAKAQELIELAIKEEQSAALAKTWYFRGYIYKDLYKEDRFSSAGHEKRNVSIESFLKTIELDEAKEFAGDCAQSLKYLSSTLYNDAAGYLDQDRMDQAQDFYDRYKTLENKINPEMDFTARDIEFMLYKASKLSVIYEKASDPAEQDRLSIDIVNLYMGVIKLDSNDIGANYNLAIHYYNQGVNIIDNMDYELPFDELFKIQEKVMELFTKALPFMLKAYELDPTRKATLQGLSGIYFGLSDIEKSEYYQKELEKLESNE